MPRSVALIRGVGGPTALKMPALRNALTDAGLRDITTLQVAGNIVTDATGRTPVELAALVRATVHASFGHDLAVIVRSHDELADAHARNPFVGTQEGRWVQTVFLADQPPTGTRPEPPAGTTDEFVIDGREVFVRYDGGIAGSKLQATWFERRLGVAGTARNANTVAKLIELSA